MTQNEIIWVLFTTLQGCVFAFVAHWTRRQQNLENTMSRSIEERTKLLVEFQGRVSRLESQWEEIQRHNTMVRSMLQRIERRLDGRLDKTTDDEE